MLKSWILLISLFSSLPLARASQVDLMSGGKILEVKELDPLKLDFRAKDIGLTNSDLWVFSALEQKIFVYDVSQRKLKKEIKLGDVGCKSTKDAKTDDPIVAVDFLNDEIALASQKGELCTLTNGKISHRSNSAGIQIHDLVLTTTQYIYSDHKAAKLYAQDKSKKVETKSIEYTGISRYFLKYDQKTAMIFVTDSDNTTVRLISTEDFKEKRMISKFGVRPSRLLLPKDSALDPKDNILYVTDSNTALIQAFRYNDGSFYGILGVNNDLLRLKHPTQLVYISEKNLFIYLNPINSTLYFIENLHKQSAELSKRLKLPLKRTDPICIQCHDGSFVDHLDIFAGVHSIIPKDKVDKVIKNPPKDFPLTEDGRVVCTSCHSQHDMNEKNSFLRRDKNSPDLCQQCHVFPENSGHPLKKIESVRMLDQAKLKGFDLHDNGLACQTCHDIHKPGEREVGVTKVELCETCHIAGGSNFTKHTDKTLKGKKLDCFGCHEVHGSVSNTNMISNANEESLNTCLGCHKEKQFASHGSHSPSNKKFADKKLFQERAYAKNPCLTCHKFHSDSQGVITGFTKEVQGGGITDINSRLCLECHEKNADNEKRWYRHDTKLSFDKVHQISNKLKIYDMNGGPFDNINDKEGQVGCLTCHSPHVGKDGDKGKIDYNQVVPFCVICHKSEGLSRYKYFHTEKYRGKKNHDN